MADAAVAQDKEPGTADAEPATASNSKENTAPAEVEDESDSKLLVPLANGNYRKILKELPDGPRIAAETCVQFWKDKKLPTEELVAFLKTISVHSPTLKKGFDDQHSGFLRAMKLQEEQQRKREEEELARRQQATWMPSYPTHMLVDSGWNQRSMYVEYMGMGDVSRYAGTMSGAAPHYGMPSDMYQGGGLGEFSPLDRAARSRAFASPGYPIAGVMGHASEASSLPHARPGPHDRGTGHLSGIAMGMRPGRRDHPSHAARGTAALQPTYNAQTRPLSTLKRGRADPEFQEDDDLDDVATDAYRRRLVSASGPLGPNSIIPQGDVDASKQQVTGADLAEARKALKGKYPRDLVQHELGEWLTARAQAVTSAVFVKVVADVRRRVHPQAGGGARGQDGEGGRERELERYASAHHLKSPSPSVSEEGTSGGASQRQYYRCKAILAFRCLPGSVGDALTFGMYVHEYGDDAPAWYRRKVLLECIDGTPLFNGETADERQRCLSAIAFGYIEFVAKEGFSHVLIRVPPPTDTNAHLFSARSADVQLKASQHLSQWYHRLMEYGMRMGTVLEYECSTNGQDISFPLSILSPRDASSELHFKRICDKLDKSEAGGMHHFSSIARSDRYFVAALRAPEEALVRGGVARDNSDLHQPLIACPLAANRHRFTSFCDQKCLFFHSIEHAQYSTMILLHQFLQQRQTPPGSWPTEEELDEEWDRQESETERELERKREREYMLLNHRIPQKESDGIDLGDDGGHAAIRKHSQLGAPKLQVTMPLHTAVIDPYGRTARGGEFGKRERQGGDEDGGGDTEEELSCLSAFGELEQDPENLGGMQEQHNTRLQDEYY